MRSLFLSITLFFLQAQLCNAAMPVGSDSEGGLTLSIELISGNIVEGADIELEIILKNERGDIGYVLHEPILVPRQIRDWYEINTTDWRSAYAETKLAPIVSSLPWYLCLGGFFDDDRASHGKKDVQDIFMESAKRVRRERGKEDDNLMFLGPKGEFKSRVKMKLDHAEKGLDLGVFCMGGWFPRETPEILKRPEDNKKYHLWTGALYIELAVPKKELKK
jgi:hypothetical protein